MKTLKDDNVLMLRDGRRLGYAEYGDPDGIPIILFHGNPGSRLIWGLLPGSPFVPGVHIIAPDRPGYGLSDYPHGHMLPDYPSDIVELVDFLGIRQFSVAGISGGGPAALACAWKIPERLTSVGVISSVGPLDKPEAYTGITKMFRALYKASHYVPWLIRLQMEFIAVFARRKPAKLQKMLEFEMSDSERQVVDGPGVKKAFVQDFPEAYRQGGKAMAKDTALAMCWPIPLEKITLEVHIWQGEQDGWIGGMGRMLAERIPNNQATFVPGAGHLIGIEMLDEIIEVLVADTST